MISPLKTNCSVPKYEMFCYEILRAQFANQCNVSARKKGKNTLATVSF